MNTAAKRVDIVKIQMVKEGSFMYPNRKIKEASDAYQLFKNFLECCDREYFYVAYLDTKNQVNAIHCCSIGTLNLSLVTPREVFKGAILSNCASILIGHNHPSGVAEPSREDIEITNRLIESGKILGIEVLDHIIMGDDSAYTSLKERGYI